MRFAMPGGCYFQTNYLLPGLLVLNGLHWLLRDTVRAGSPSLLMSGTHRRGSVGGGGCSLGVELLSSIVQPTALSPSSTKKKTYSLLTEFLGQQVGKLTG